MGRDCRYVVLHHTGYGEAHYDFMIAIDDDGPLLTWRCPRWPIEKEDEFIPLPDHRRVYLSYEGEVSNGRGEVKRVASGVLAMDAAEDSHVVIVLDERRMTLRRAVKTLMN